MRCTPNAEQQVMDASMLQSLSRSPLPPRASNVTEESFRVGQGRVPMNECPTAEASRKKFLFFVIYKIRKRPNLITFFFSAWSKTKMKDRVRAPSVRSWIFQRSPKRSRSTVFCRFVFYMYILYPNEKIVMNACCY